MANIRLCRRDVKGTAGIFQHTFILYTDDNGFTRVFSANTDNGNMFTGNIKIDIGVSYKGHSDYPADGKEPSCGEGVSGTDESLKPRVDKLYEFSYKVRDMEPDYKPKDQNCNTYTSGAAAYSGLALDLPKGYSNNWQFMGSKHQFHNTEFDLFNRAFFGHNTKFTQVFNDRLRNDPAFLFAFADGMSRAFNYYRTNSWDTSGSSWQGAGRMGADKASGNDKTSSARQSTSGSSTSGSTPGSGSGSSPAGNQQRSYDGGSWRQGSDGKWRQQSSGSEQQRSNHQQGQQFRDGQQNSPRQDQWSGNQQQSQNGQWQRQQEQQFREQQRQEQQRNEFRQSYQQRQSGGPGASDNFGSQSWGRDFRSDNQNTDTSSGRQQGSSWFGGGFSDGWGWREFRQSNRRGYNQHQNYGSRASHGSGYYYGPGHSSSRWQRAFENLWTFWRDPSWSNMGSWTAGVRANMRYARSHVSPLVLDLDDDGLKLRGHDEGVYFDIDGDRFLERVGWPDASEAQLARDLSANGVIDNIEELFGDDQISAFFKLGLLDSNRDEIIDEHDLAFDELLLWQDKNYNGYSEPNELRTLKDAGIKSISLLARINVGSIKTQRFYHE